MKWKNRLSCYHNSLSVKQLENLLINCGLEKDEFIIIDVRESDELQVRCVWGFATHATGIAIRNVKKNQIENLKEKKICTYYGTEYGENIVVDELVESCFNAIALDGLYSS